MVTWRRCQPSSFSLSSAFPRVVSLFNLPTHVSQIYFLKRFHGGAKLEEIPVGTLPLDAYNELIKAGSIKQDPNQIAALQPLERLHQELENYAPSAPDSFTSKLFSSLRRHRETPRGVYIYGGVGCGKSLVADIFFHCSPIKTKRRVHFHQFMLDVHKRLHQRRLTGDKAEKGDVVEVVAEDLLKAGWLLCFDEFQVLDIADAIILKRLFECLFKAGAVMVASSNRAPSELYKNGFQRELFLPCIELIKERCHVQAFRPDAPDYRLIGARPDGTGYRKDKL